ncbi:unnamed protein product, partial [Pylaiella littoralis]
GGDGVGKRDCFEPSTLSASSEGGDLWGGPLEPSTFGGVPILVFCLFGLVSVAWTTFGATFFGRAKTNTNRITNTATTTTTTNDNGNDNDKNKSSKNSNSNSSSRANSSSSTGSSARSKERRAGSGGGGGGSVHRTRDVVGDPQAVAAAAASTAAAAAAAEAAVALLGPTMAVTREQERLAPSESRISSHRGGVNTGEDGGAGDDNNRDGCLAGISSSAKRSSGVLAAAAAAACYSLPASDSTAGRSKTERDPSRVGGGSAGVGLFFTGSERRRGAGAGDGAGGGGGKDGAGATANGGGGVSGWAEAGDEGGRIRRGSTRAVQHKVDDGSGAGGIITRGDISTDLGADNREEEEEEEEAEEEEQCFSDTTRASSSVADVSSLEVDLRGLEFASRSGTTTHPRRGYDESEAVSKGAHADDERILTAAAAASCPAGASGAAGSGAEGGEGEARSALAMKVDSAPAATALDTNTPSTTILGVGGQEQQGGGRARIPAKEGKEEEEEEEKKVATKTVAEGAPKGGEIVAEDERRLLATIKALISELERDLDSARVLLPECHRFRKVVGCVADAVGPGMDARPRQAMDVTEALREATEFSRTLSSPEAFLIVMAELLADGFEDPTAMLGYCTRRLSRAVSALPEPYSSSSSSRAAAAAARSQLRSLSRGPGASGGGGGGAGNDGTAARSAAAAAASSTARVAAAAASATAAAGSAAGTAAAAAAVAALVPEPPSTASSSSTATMAITPMPVLVPVSVSVSVTTEVAPQGGCFSNRGVQTAAAAAAVDGGVDSGERGGREWQASVGLPPGGETAAAAEAAAAAPTVYATTESGTDGAAAENSENSSGVVDGDVAGRECALREDGGNDGSAARGRGEEKEEREEEEVSPGAACSGDPSVRTSRMGPALTSEAAGLSELIRRRGGLSALSEYRAVAAVLRAAAPRRQSAFHPQQQQQQQQQQQRQARSFFEMELEDGRLSGSRTGGGVPLLLSSPPVRGSGAGGGGGDLAFSSRYGSGEEGDSGSG